MGIGGGSLAWLSPAVVSAFDTDAQAFFAAANITDSTQQNAVNTLVTALKTNDTWSKYHVLYPFVGGTASTHSYNLKNPSLFQITWSGTVTHNANGITGSGNGAGNTGYTPSTSGTLGNNHLAVYCRTNKTAANQVEMGAIVGSTAATWSEWGLQLKDGSNNFFPSLLAGNFVDYPSVSNTDSRGLHVATRANTTTVQAYKNGVSVLNATQAQTFLNGGSIRILTTNRNGTNERWSVANLALASIGTNITSTEVANDYAAIQAFQTSLGRQV